MSTDTKKQIYKPRPVTGFPEWLPEVRLVEQQWFDHIRRIFESYGFCSIETPSVEELDVLRAKGEVDKEIYTLERLHKDENDKSDARLALHFDQTVPLARYVAQNFNELVFPFKRYQMQRVWRGERPQKGRFREFYQCDIDVIGSDTLPLHFDSELPAIMWEIMTGLHGMEKERIQIRVNNRKIWLGLLDRIECSDAAQVMRTVDKLEKIGAEAVAKILLDELHVSATDTQSILALAQFKATPKDIANLSTFVTPANELMAEGINELTAVMNALSHLPDGAVIADLAIVRGLDYYTGTVYETVFLDDPGYGSICSGGRYEDLAGSFINKHLPGVGISIGFSRLFARMVDQQKINTSRKSPAHIMVIMGDESRRNEIAKAANALRARGFNVEMYHAAKKIPDQLKYASRKGIPFVWFAEADGTHQVKNMASGEQSAADVTTWVIPEGQ